MEARKDVKTTLNYVKNTGRKPVLSQDEDAYIEYEPSEVLIHDIRPEKDSVSLQHEGFGVAHLESSVEDFYNNEEVGLKYYPEIREVAKQVSGAKEIFIFGHAQRANANAKQRPENLGNPVHIVHNDYTKQAAQQILDSINSMTNQTLSLTDGSHLWFLNAWQPIKGPVVQEPLAICRADTLDADDAIPTELRLPNFIIDIESVSHNRNHHWAYLSDMTTSELLFFKGFDTHSDGENLHTAHTTFAVPNLPANPPPRESIEVRLVAVF